MKTDLCAFISYYRPAAVLRVTGEDALAFLQGQFTQELRSASPALCAYGLWLNQKGKVLADSFALRDGPGWWLVSYGSQGTAIRERLEAYIIADDVVVEDLTDSWTGAAVVGSDATAWLQSQGWTLPAKGEWALIEGKMVFRGRRGGDESWEWLSPVSAVESPEKWGWNLNRLDAAALDQRRIRAGIPFVPCDVGPADLPNEAGLEEAAISYSKGCYLGQEVMARLKSMGQVRRRLLRVQGLGAAPTCPAALFAGAKKVGELRSAVVDEAGQGFVGLAMISLLGLEGTEGLSLETNGAPSVQVFRDSSSS